MLPKPPPPLLLVPLHRSHHLPLRSCCFCCLPLPHTPSAALNICSCAASAAAPIIFHCYWLMLSLPPPPSFRRMQGTVHRTHHITTNRNLMRSKWAAVRDSVLEDWQRIALSLSLSLSLARDFPVADKESIIYRRRRFSLCRFCRSHHLQLLPAAHSLSSFAVAAPAQIVSRRRRHHHRSHRLQLKSKTGAAGPQWLTGGK